MATVAIIIPTRYSSYGIINKLGRGVNNVSNTQQKKRLNIVVDAELHKQLKMKTVEQDKTIVEYVTEAIREKIERDNK